MAYRSDLEALAARHAALAQEVAEKTRERDEAAQMLAEARDRDREAHRVANGAANRARRAMLIVSAVSTAIVALVIGGVAHVETKRAEREQFEAQLVAGLERFAADACECTTPTCVNEVNVKITAWSTEISKLPGSDALPNPGYEKRVEEIAARMARCFARVPPP